MPHSLLSFVLSLGVVGGCAAGEAAPPPDATGASMPVGFADAARSAMADAATEAGVPDVVAAAGCPSFDNGATQVSETVIVKDLPTPTGGSIAPGRYHLASAARYVGAGGSGTTNDELRHTLVVSGSGGAMTVQLVAQTGKNPPKLFTWNGSVNAAKLTRSQSCAMSPLKTDSIGFSAGPGELTLIDPDSTEPRRGKVHSYARQP